MLSLVNVQSVKICRHISYMRVKPQTHETVSDGPDFFLRDINHYRFSFWEVELGKYYISDGEVSKVTILSNNGLNNYTLPTISQSSLMPY